MMRPELAGLRALAEALPPGTPIPVPAEVLRELLGGEGRAEGMPTVVPADLTVCDLAVRFGRKPSTVRGWCEVGRFPGAYRLHGREWRIPAVALATFEAEARNGSKPVSPMSRRKPANLGTWRTAS